MDEEDTMEYIYAALLLHRLGKDVSEVSVRKILQAAGAEPDDVKIKALVSALSEVNIDEALKSAAAVPAAPPPPAAAASAAPEAPKEEKKEEKEEEALAGLSTLFG